MPAREVLELSPVDPQSIPQEQPKEDNRLRPEDRSVHDWYRFVLSFPPHLVRDYVERFRLAPDTCVLDPFCGTGTTLVECKKLGLSSIGLEANPMLALASRTKVAWDVDPAGLLTHAREVARQARKELEAEGIADCDLEEMPLFRGRNGKAPKSLLRTLPDGELRLLLKNSISPLPLHKSLLLLDVLRRMNDPAFASHEHLALATALVGDISNLHFGPEVGIGPAKSDAQVLEPWLRVVARMSEDLQTVTASSSPRSVVEQADARAASLVLGPRSIDAVITSPPYPNEKDYTRTTRLESVLLGLVRSKQELRGLKQNLMRSNTRNVYKDDDDHVLIEKNPAIAEIAEEIEKRRLALGKTSGWERMYAKVTKLYFGGMARHLQDLQNVLKPGARLAYVVGDQASFFRVMIPTGRLLAEIAASLGYEVLGIDLFRTRRATATREQLREEVVLLRWPGATAQR
jgi:tRNA G10  N-methylase Trm11